MFTPPPTKAFSRGQGIVGQDLDLYIDCFVSCFRITPHNNDVLKICLNPHSPPIYHFVLVNALHRIITQVIQYRKVCCKEIDHFHIFIFSRPNNIPEKRICLEKCRETRFITWYSLFQQRLPWWPSINIIYGKAAELRSMFTDTLNKVTQGMATNPTPKVIGSSIPYVSIAVSTVPFVHVPSYQIKTNSYLVDSHGWIKYMVMIWCSL